MRPLSYVRATHVAEAVATVAADPRREFLAGGTTEVDLIRAHVLRPDLLVDINDLPLAGIEDLDDGGLRIGALARMSDVAAAPAVVSRYPAVSQALLLGASQQLRNMASIGGNLCQRTRCAVLPRRRVGVQQACAGNRLRGDRRAQPRPRDPGGQRAVHRHASLRPRGRVAGARRGCSHGRPRWTADDRDRRLLSGARRASGPRTSARLRRADRRGRVAGRPDRQPVAVSQVPRPAVLRVRARLDRGGADGAGRRHHRRARGSRRRRDEAVEGPPRRGEAARRPRGPRPRSPRQRTRSSAPQSCASTMRSRWSSRVA